jgi:hypothetical protein
MRNTDQMFDYFQDHWTDQGSLIDTAWAWWFDGIDRSGPYGLARENVQGGGFFRNVNFASVFRAEVNPAAAMSSLNNMLRSGYGTALGILTHGGGHAITCWGVSYRGGNPGNIAGVWVTDSDDNMGSRRPPNRLRYYGVTYSGGRWYLNNYGGSNSWHVAIVYGLQRRWTRGLGNAGASQQLVGGSFALGQAAAAATHESNLVTSFDATAHRDSDPGTNIDNFALQTQWAVAAAADASMSFTITTEIPATIDDPEGHVALQRCQDTLDDVWSDPFDARQSPTDLANEFAVQGSNNRPAKERALVELMDWWTAGVEV